MRAGVIGTPGGGGRFGVLPRLLSPCSEVRKRQAGLSKPGIVTCSTCFIRSRSGSVLPKIEEPRAGPANPDNSAITRHRSPRQLPNELATADLNRFLLNCQQGLHASRATQTTLCRNPVPSLAP